jgi:prepilin peptidase CpaA
MQTLTIIQIIAIAIAVVCAAIDFRTRKIPNLITFPAWGIGIILNFVLLGAQAGLWAIVGLVVGVFIMMLPDPRNKVGFGDCKLMGAMGAFLGWKIVVIAWGYYAISYGLIALVRLLTAIPWGSFKTMVHAASVGAPATLDAKGAAQINEKMKEKIPIGPAVAIGVILAVLLEKTTLQFLGFPG